MKGDEEFTRLGMVDAGLGNPRHRFQDPHLQRLYDQGYNTGAELKEVLEHWKCRNCGNRTSIGHNLCWRCS